MHISMRLRSTGAVISRRFDVGRFSNFFGAVTTRQAACFCRDGIDPRRTVELLDPEVEAFDDPIATQCSGIRVTSSIGGGGSIASRNGGGAP
jgi:hypothetical protein